METAKEMYQYCVDNDYGKGISESWSIKHFKIIEDSLQEDEDVKITFIGLHNYKSATKHDKFHAYAITNKRILIGQKKLFGQNFKTVSLDYINDVNFESGMAYGILTIDTMKEVFAVAFNKKHAKKISDEIQTFIYDLKEENQEKKETPKKSTVEELKELKELLDSGGINQEEYEHLKEDIIENR